MIPQIHLTTLVYAFAAVWAVALVLDGTQVTTKLFKPCGTVAGAIGLLLLFFDRWAWSIRYLHPWFVDKPYIKGTWKGMLCSNYIDPLTTERVPPVEVYLVIRQTQGQILLAEKSDTIYYDFETAATGSYRSLAPPAVS